MGPDSTAPAFRLPLACSSCLRLNKRRRRDTLVASSFPSAPGPTQVWLTLAMSPQSPFCWGLAASSWVSRSLAVSQETSGYMGYPCACLLSFPARLALLTLVSTCMGEASPCTKYYTYVPAYLPFSFPSTTPLSHVIRFPGKEPLDDMDASHGFALQEGSFVPKVRCAPPLSFPSLARFIRAEWF